MERDSIQDRSATEYAEEHPPSDSSTSIDDSLADPSYKPKGGEGKAKKLAKRERRSRIISQSSHEVTLGGGRSKVKKPRIHITKDKQEEANAALVNTKERKKPQRSKITTQSLASLAKSYPGKRKKMVGKNKKKKKRTFVDLTKKQFTDVCNMPYNEWTNENKMNLFLDILREEDKTFVWPIETPELVTNGKKKKR